MLEQEQKGKLIAKEAPQKKVWLIIICYYVWSTVIIEQDDLNGFIEAFYPSYLWERAVKALTNPRSSVGRALAF